MQSMNIGKYRLYRFILPLLEANMFIIISNRSALIIDPNENDVAIDLLREKDVNKLLIMLTHEHFDHISGVNRLRQYIDGLDGDKSCKVVCSRKCADAIINPDTNLAKFFRAMFITRSEEERSLAEVIFSTDYKCESDISFEEKTELFWEDIRLVSKETPGHSPGSICIEMYENEHLLAVVTGDSLVQGNKVVTRLPESSKSDYRNITLPYLEKLDPDTLILPGHGEISYMSELELG